MTRKKRLQPWQHQGGFAVLAVTAALLLTQLLWPLLRTTPTPLFFAAVMLSSWYGGWRSGLLATGLSVLAIDYFVMSPALSFTTIGSDLVLLGIFSAIALLTSWMNETRIRTEEKLRQNEEYYRLMMEGIKDCELFVLDPQGYIVRCNAGAEQLKGYRINELIGQHISCFYPSDAIAQDKPHRALEAAALQDRFEEEGWRVRKDGSRFWAEVVITALRDGDGQLQGFFKFTYDVSHRKQREDQLRRSLKDLSDMKFALDKAAIVASTDPSGKITDVNDKFCQISQYSREELIGQDHRIINSGYHSKAFFKQLWSTITTGQVWHGEIKNQAKDGSEYWVDTTIVPFLDEAKKPFRYLVIRFDITEQKRIQAALKLAQTSLEERVQQRTAELGSANIQLHEEVVVRRQAQQALEEQTTQLIEQAELLDLAYDSILVRRLDDSTVTFWNRGAEQMYGWVKADVLGADSHDLLQTRFPMSREAIRALLFEHDRWEGELVQTRRDGTRCIVASRWALQRDSQGNPISVLEINNDITARKQVEESLQQERHFLDAVLENIEDGIVACDANGNLSFFNQATHKLYGLPQEALQPQQWAQHYGLYYADGQTPMQQHDIPLFRALQGERVQDVEVVIKPQMGTPRVVLASGRSIVDAEEQKLGAVVSMHDITAYKRVETSLREHAKQLQQSLSFEAMLKRITDKVRDSLDETQILQAAVMELGRELQALCCDTSLYDLKHGTSTIVHEYCPGMTYPQRRVKVMSEFPEGYRQLLQGQEFQFCNRPSAYRQEQQAILACPIIGDQGIIGDLWLCKPGEVGFSELEVRLVQQVANQLAIALRQAGLYEESQTQVKTLERLNWLKDDFLSTVSHELRTPVSNMRLSIRMLQIVMGIEQPTPAQREKTTQYLQILNNECQREISLINDLLDLQRLEAGKQAISLGAIDLPNWLSEVVEPFKERTQSRQQSLEIDLPTEALPPLISDMASLERILTELLNNACKYTPPGEKIAVRACSHPDKLQLQVLNSGAEIPAAELPRIFDKFYRVPNADPWKQGGTGLGLALVKKLAEHLGGMIHVVSANYQTVFTVELPIVNRESFAS